MCVNIMILRAVEFFYLPQMFLIHGFNIMSLAI